MRLPRLGPRTDRLSIGAVHDGRLETPPGDLGNTSYSQEIVAGAPPAKSTADIVPPDSALPAITFPF